VAVSVLAQYRCSATAGTGTWDQHWEDDGQLPIILEVERGYETAAAELPLNLPRAGVGWWQ